MRSLCAVLLFWSTLALAQYPAKPIHLIVPFPPGGGSVGAELAAKAAHDGYTLFLAGVGSQVVNPNLHKKLGYDPLKDFAPITLIASAPSVLVVNPKVPAQNIAEFTAYARAHPGVLNYASNGNGSAAQLAAAM